MRKGIAWLLTLILVLLSCSAVADGNHFIMAGYDSEGSKHIWTDNQFFQRMEERTGLVFTFQQSMVYEEWENKLSDMMSDKADDPMPDVLFKAELTPAQTQRWYEQGKLIDLRPYLAENAPNLSALLAAHPEWEKAITLPDGAIVALPGLNELQNNNAIWINTAWLASLGLEKPTTAEEFLAVLRAFKTGDPNHNGKQDEIPLTFTSLWDLRFLGSAFGLCVNDYYMSGDSATGEVFFAANSDQLHHFVTWLKCLWDEGLIDHNGFLSADSTRAITDANAVITYGMVFGPSVLQMLPSSAVQTYDVLMPLHYEGKAVYRDLLGDVVRGTFAITSACEDPAALVRWVDFLYSEEGEHLAQAGEEGVDFVMLSDGTWEWIDDASTVANTVLTDVVIVGGGSMPGYSSAAFQRNYADESTHNTVEQLYALKQQSRYPYPIVYLSKANQTRVAEIWSKMGPYIEETLIHFIVGDEELTDETWQTYIHQLQTYGADEFVSIWQEAIQ